MTTRPFRFGLNLIPSGSKADLQKACRMAEDLGFDLVTVSDYITLSLPPVNIAPWTTVPPFFALLAAAEVTSRVKLGTYSLNASMYRPALLVREVIAAQQLTEGRIELGMGAGYLKADFEVAEVPWANAAERIGRLERLVAEFRRLMRGPVPPLLLGTSTSDEMLKLAAREADIVSFTGAESKTEFSRARLVRSAKLAEQCDLVRSVAGDRIGDIEMNILVHALHLTDDRDVTTPSFPNVEDLPPDELRNLPGILSGSAESIAEDLHRYRETYGISYYTIRFPNMFDFAKVMKLVR
jgi:probable F420-dependent oxidoreductase